MTTPIWAVEGDVLAVAGAIDRATMSFPREGVYNDSDCGWEDVSVRLVRRVPS